MVVVVVANRVDPLSASVPSSARPRQPLLRPIHTAPFCCSQPGTASEAKKNHPTATTRVGACVGRVVDLSGTCPGHVSPTLGTVGALRPVGDGEAAVGAVEAAVLEEGVGHAVGQPEARCGNLLSFALGVSGGDA